VGMACVCCGGWLGEDRRAEYGLCRACHARLEDELADAALRVARPARPDAETVTDEPLPAGFMGASSTEATPARDAAER
jgi:hypothetical protein